MNLKSFTIRAGTIRLTRGLHNSLYFLSSPENHINPDDGLPPHVIDPEMEDLGLAEAVPNRPGFYTLTALGRALADFAPSAISGKKASPPRLSLTSILNCLPEDTQRWLLSETTPLPDDSAAPFFERLGVIHYLAYGGSAGWCFTVPGRDAISAWQSAKFGVRERMRRLFSDNQRALLAMASISPNDPSLKSVDKRTLRSLGPDGYNFLIQTQTGLHIRPEVAKLVEALTSSRPIRPVELFEMFPHEDKLWFMAEFTAGFGARAGEVADNPRAELMRQMGWINLVTKKRITYTDLGREIKEEAYQLSVTPVSEASYAADLGHEIEEAFSADPHGIAHLDFSDHNVRLERLETSDASIDPPQGYPSYDAPHNPLDDFDLIGHTEGSTASASADEFDFI